MNKSKVSPNAIKQAILKESIRIKRKEQLYEEIKKINAELGLINEESEKILSEIGMAGSFGFVGDMSDKHKHGFEDNKFQNISNIARLEAEFNQGEKKEAINEDIIDENAKLKAEIESLKRQLANK